MEGQQKQEDKRARKRHAQQRADATPEPAPEPPPAPTTKERAELAMGALAFAPRLTGAALSASLATLAPAAHAQTPRTWTADNGNGTFTNPLFHDEFSDPDIIRVGDEFYLTGTTMHAMPGLPVLHSTDLVNWEL